MSDNQWKIPRGVPAARRSIALLGTAALAGLAVARPGGEATLAERYLAACGHEACMESRLLGPLPGRDAGGRIDPETGRDILNYPPDRVVDYDHMLLRLFIPDMNVPEATAVQTLRFTPIGSGLASLALDAVALDISKVELGGRALEFDHDGLVLRVAFDPPLPAGEMAEIQTTFTIRGPRNGLIWSPASPDWPGRAAQIHTQGEPQTSSNWFPCHDFPNEKLTTQIVVTVPEGFIASANGRMVSRKPIEVAGRAYETFDWLQDTPHPNYLVTLVVGEFDVVDVGTRTLPMPVYVPPGRGADVAATYGKTAEMVAFFGRRLDEPYPWDQYAQLVVWNFGWGGMENTSATTMYDTAILSPEALADHDLEGLISHELGHQWFGDLVTCNSWEHIWLNEGFATYMTALWFEHSRGADDYQASIRGNFDSVIGAARGHAPTTPAMVSKSWAAPWETFRRQNNPYPHGSSVLHMLRRRLGDDVFFAGVAEYLDRMHHRSAETRDFRRALEDVSGESLERFFWQWCERPGVPRLDLEIEWDSAAHTLVVRAEQTQHIDGYNPAYAIDLPIAIGRQVATGEMEWTTHSLSMDARSRELDIPLDGAPAIVAVDPEMAVLAELAIEQPVDRWIAQLHGGPTLASRIQAARAIGAMEPAAVRKDDGERSADVAALEAVARDSSNHELLRSECIRALADRDEALPLVELIGTDRPAVRVAAINAVVAALADSPDRIDLVSDAVPPLLAELAERAGPTTVRAAAVRGLGRLKPDGALQDISSALGVDSQDDAIRQAALEALASLDDAAGLRLAIEHTHARHNSRTRAVAIGSAVKLAHHDPDAVLTALGRLLRDPQRRSFLAAGQGMVDLADARGLADLRALRADVPDPDSRWSLDSWIHALEEKLAAAAESDGR